MTKKGKSLFNRIVSLMLAAVMVVTVFAVTAPVEVQAAQKTTLKGTGTDSLTISDANCYKGSSMRTYYIKYKAGKTGFVTLTFKNASKAYSYSAGYVTLCNSKKKAIGPAKEYWSNGYSSSSAYSRSYGVKKGTTYYFKVQCAAGTKIVAKTTAVTKSTANTKAKAKKLAKNKTVKGIMIAGENKADWYKINITGNCKKLTLTLTGKSQGDDDNCGIKMSFYDTDGKLVKTSRTYYISGQASKDQLVFNYGTGATSFSFPTGTYWAKIERLNSKSSGYYTFKWNY